MGLALLPRPCFHMGKITDTVIAGWEYLPVRGMELCFRVAIGRQYFSL